MIISSHYLLSNVEGQRLMINASIRANRLPPSIHSPPTRTISLVPCVRRRPRGGFIKLFGLKLLRNSNVLVLSKILKVRD